MRFSWMERTPVRQKTGAVWGYYKLLKAVKNPERGETSEDRLRNGVTGGYSI